MTLKCLAEGKQKPTITWTRLSDNHIVTMPIINIRRHDSKTYRCTAYNGIGMPATKEVSIDVQCKCYVELTSYSSNDHYSAHWEIKPFLSDSWKLNESVGFLKSFPRHRLSWIKEAGRE